MARSIATRAIVPIALAVTGFVVLNCILLYALLAKDMTDDAARQARDISATVMMSTRHAMLASDRDALRTIIGNIGRQSGVVHLRIFNPRGVVMVAGNQSERMHTVNAGSERCDGCHPGGGAAVSPPGGRDYRRYVNQVGREVLAVTTPIYNDESCAAAPCHAHPAGQRILGMLDIGIDQAPLRRTLTQMRQRMAVFCVLVLVLTVGGSAALLSRTVFMPLRLLAEFAERRGNVTIEHDALSGSDEIARIARNLREVFRLEQGGRRKQSAAREMDVERIIVRFPTTPSREHVHDAGTIAHEAPHSSERPATGVTGEDQ